MDANQLLHYLRGFFELVPEASPEQIRAIRNEVLRSKPVTPEFVPIEVVNAGMRKENGPCGCSGKKTTTVTS